MHWDLVFLNKNRLLNKRKVSGVSTAVGFINSRLNRTGNSIKAILDIVEHN